LLKTTNARLNGQVFVSGFCTFFFARKVKTEIFPMQVLVRQSLPA
jgi:hypothetical protein